MSSGLKEGLSALVKRKYTAAKAAGALTYADSHLAIVPIAGIPFQLRYCPSLAKKPTDQKTTSKPKKKIDPFEDPDPQLLVSNVPHQAQPSHCIVLNKFPIIQNHFILATVSADLLQSQLLNVDDLVRTYQCLTEWERSGDDTSSEGRAFAFFNSGEHSGASQPHRHIQLLPVNDMREGDTGKGWNLLMDLILKSQQVSFASHEYHVHPDLPFVHFGQTLPAACDGHKLWKSYMDLYKATLASVRRFRNSRSDELPLHATDNSSSPISYNLAMTKEGMVMCPRKSEGKVMTRADGTELDYVALNGTMLGGTLMVKNDEVWHLLQNDNAKLDSVLEAAGIASRYGNLDQDDFTEQKNLL